MLLLSLPFRRRRALARSCASFLGAIALSVHAAPKAGQPISYNRDIRPLLSDKCFACHGPDAGKRKGKLRLDIREAALEREAFVPGKPQESEFIRRIATATADPGVLALEQEVLAYPNLAHVVCATPDADRSPDLLVPVELELGDQVLSLFTTLTSFGTPRDITLAELAVELFYPVDPSTEAALRTLAAG